MGTSSVICKHKKSEHTWPDHINVVMVAPKGMGPSVRRLYEQGEAVNGAGINASVAIEQDKTGNATDIALGWSIALGSPYSFSTTLKREYQSDIFGERGILLGGVHGLIEALFRHYVLSCGLEYEQAFVHAAECITGPLSTIISHDGLKAVRASFVDPIDVNTFDRAYHASYDPCRSILEECYDEVACGNEIQSVNMAVQRHARFPIGKIDQTLTWRVGEKVRAKRDPLTNPIPMHPVTAGTFCAMMMAQIDCLIDHGHCYSEVANESVIEAVDSLNPYMHARGVAYMVDNCSTTARLGARKWAPRFDYILTEQALVTMIESDSNLNQDETIDMTAFETHKIHDVLATCGQLRPTVDIAVL